MKKILISILILASLSVSCQTKNEIDIKDTMKYMVYVHDTLYSSHDNVSNALQNYLNLLRTNHKDSVEILPYGKIFADVGSDFFVADTVFSTIYKDSIVYKDIPVQKYSKDSVALVRVIASIKYNDSIKLSALFKDGSTFSIDADSLLIDGLASDKLRPLKIKYYIHKYGDNEYTIKMETNLTDRFRPTGEKSIIREQDSTKTVVQTYMNKDWLFSKIEGNSVDNLSDWTIPDYTAGQPIINGEQMYRHTHTFYTKFYKIKAVSKDNGDEFFFDIQVNKLIP